MTWYQVVDYKKGTGNIYGAIPYRSKKEALAAASRLYRKNHDIYDTEVIVFPSGWARSPFVIWLNGHTVMLPTLKHGEHR